MSLAWNFVRDNATFLLFIHALFSEIGASPLQKPASCKLFTTTKDFRTLECSVGLNEYLDYRDVRTFTASTNGIQYNVTIACSGGRIYLPWPFRARHVSVLNVWGCGIDGFLSEYSIIPDLPNELQTVSMANIETKIEVKDLYSVLTNVKQLPKKNECGLAGAKSIRYHNMAYEFSYDMTSSEDMLLLEQLLSTDALKKDFLQTGGDCLFPNLEYLEESGSRSVSSIHFKLIESSFYPKLREYVISNNSLARVPKELRSLNLHFLPKIEKLDLSHNSITELNFINLKANDSVNKIFVDLRNNLIRSFSAQDLDMLVWSNGIVFDLRENPLECSCSLSKYGDYLIEQNSASANEVFNGMTCLSNNKRFLISERSFASRFCKY